MICKNMFISLLFIIVLRSVTFAKNPSTSSSVPAAEWSEVQWVFIYSRYCSLNFGSVTLSRRGRWKWPLWGKHTQIVRLAHRPFLLFFDGRIFCRCTWCLTAVKQKTTGKYLIVLCVDAIIEKDATVRVTGETAPDIYLE